MILSISDEFRVETDERNGIINRLDGKRTTPGHSEVDIDNWEPIQFYGSLDNALRGFAELGVKKIESAETGKVIRAIRELFRDVRSAIETIPEELQSPEENHPRSIEINEIFSIQSDLLTWAVRRYVGTRKPRKRSEDDDVWEYLTYWNTLNEAFLRTTEHALRRIESSDPREILNAIKRIRKDVISAIRAVNLRRESGEESCAASSRDVIHETDINHGRKRKCGVKNPTLVNTETH